MIAQAGRFRLMNSHGSGMIKLACNVSGCPVVRSINVTVELLIGSKSVQRSGIACLVLPGLKVHDLGSADTKEDSKNFETRCFLSQRRVEARATLFNITKVKSGRESDRFNMITRVTWVAQLVVVSRNCCMQPNAQTGDCVREGRAEIRVGGAAVAGPPTGVYRECLRFVSRPVCGMNDTWLGGRLANCLRLTCCSPLDLK
jgi:hypothetical protein